MSFLKNHPFAVEAFFESSLVLTFAIPKEELIHLIPECLSLELLNDKWAFLAVAIVKTKHLRPKGFPKFMGNNFILTGYRIFVRYTNNAGKRLRGLYIIKSETDSKKMEYLGNIFTHYNYTTTDINIENLREGLSVSSSQSGLNIRVETDGENIPLPWNSPFVDWKEARRFAGPLPFTFTYDAGKKEVLIIEGVRENWIPEPVNVTAYNIPLLKTLQLGKSILANAFIIRNIPYFWKKGKTEKWNQ
ncbi:DUF2071 domain-containing protein [Mucilaginibacter sp. RB4R14]|uniref:DUF2071 domain-containing protein n=1 Tax=Mucilaginibacter aurantiaciroseus TaxID=2949308 RepID=UPI0020913371|nr:DUF2071 domain-containing protein [Mucilaginibacter aurantiaciroseus]MCO5935135.1 DUF2071 domain-containing protein [Mucilaginibacter aurantiaciroseus]